jgi:hypothetical protein
MNTSTPIATGEITNSCTCTEYDPDTGDEILDENGNPIPSMDCYGFCWESAIDDFSEVTKELRDSNETNWWKCQDLRLWNGEVSGYFHANTVTKLIEGMTVRSEWIMRYEVFADRIEYSLSHHDSPMGSSTTLLPITEEEREELGLY